MPVRCRYGAADPSVSPGGQHTPCKTPPGRAGEHAEHRPPREPIAPGTGSAEHPPAPGGTHTGVGRAPRGGKGVGLVAFGWSPKGNKSCGGKTAASPPRAALGVIRENAAPGVPAEERRGKPAVPGRREPSPPPAFCSLA